MNSKKILTYTEVEKIALNIFEKLRDKDLIEGDRDKLDRIYKIIYNTLVIYILHRDLNHS